MSERRSLRIIVTGFSPSLRDLADELSRQAGIELVGAAGRIGEGEWAFRGQALDVVVHAVPPGPPPLHDVTEIRQYTQAPIILLAERATAEIFDAALDAGVADVIALPERAEHVAFAIRKAARAASSAAGEHGARVITVFSPKGGTGKTVLATNLAARLAKRDGVRTLLLDLDLQFGDAAIMLGISPERTLLDLVTAPGELDAEKLGGYLSRHGGSGLDVLPAPLRPEESDLVSEAKVERVFQVAGPGYEVLVVDTSPSFHGPMLSALDRSDALLLLCTPEVPTLKNVRLGIETLQKLSFPEERINIVLNRADADGAISRAEVEAALGMPVAFEVPNAHDVPAMVNQGRPLALSSPDSPFGASVAEIYPALVGVERVRAGHRHGLRNRAGLARSVRDLAAAWLHPRAEKAPSATPGPEAQA